MVRGIEPLTVTQFLPKEDSNLYLSPSGILLPFVVERSHFLLRKASIVRTKFSRWFAANSV